MYNNNNKQMKVEVEVEGERVKKAYDEMKKVLTDKEADVITSFYGINRNVRHSLAEIGTKYGVTRERIRQIKTKAMRKLELIPPYESPKK